MDNRSVIKSKHSAEHGATDIRIPVLRLAQVLSQLLRLPIEYPASNNFLLEYKQ